MQYIIDKIADAAGWFNHLDRFGWCMWGVLVGLILGWLVF